MKLTIRANVPPGGFQPDGVEMGADTKLVVGRMGYGLRDTFRLFYSKLLFDAVNFTEDDRLALQLLANELILNHESGNGILDNTCINVLNDIIKSGECSSIGIVKNRLVNFGLIFANEREFYGRIGQISQRDFSIYYKRRTSKKHHQKHIGVGYQDKGTTQIHCVDGSPSWQEVASRNRAIPVVDLTDFQKSETSKEQLMNFFYEGYTRTVRMYRYSFKKDGLTIELWTDNYTGPTDGAAEAMHQNGYPQKLVEHEGRKYFILSYITRDGKKFLKR